MNILVTGITSMHGWPIFNHFSAFYGTSVYGIYPLKMASYFKHNANTFGCNIEDFSALQAIFNKVQPDAVIHAGGVCDLDACEDNPGFAYDVNVGGACNIVQLIDNQYLLYISSDLVFCGRQTYENGYNETHIPTPVSVVGKTYLEAEHVFQQSQHLGIIRIGLPIGPSLPGTKGAIDFIKKRLKMQRKMTLFYDEVRSLIYTNDLAYGIQHCFDKKLKGIFHYGGTKKYSLYDIGHYLVEKYNYTRHCLIRTSRHDDIYGPPRVGDISLNSSRFYQATGFVPAPVFNR